MDLANLKKDLYVALHGNDEEVINLCGRTQEGPLQVCTILNQTVLYIALYNNKIELANKLFDDLSENLLSKLTTCVNVWGNTLLHGVSVNDEGVEFAKKLLQKAPQLLVMRNKWGETALFQASRYGQKKMFEFLADQVAKYRASHPSSHLHDFFQREDKTNILQMTILLREFDIALMIATKHPSLCNEQAQDDQMTALQLLACCPMGFKSGAKLGFLKELVYSSVLTDDEQRNEVGSMNVVNKAFSFLSSTGKYLCTLPLIEEMRQLKRDHEIVSKLANILVKNDPSSKSTYSPVAEFTPVITCDNFQEGDHSNQPENVEKVQKMKKKSKKNIPNYKETPLVLAAKNGCIEIVEKILKEDPLELDHLNKNRENLLHVVIWKRQMDIFQLLKKYMSFKWMIRDIDKQGNTVLHMVGLKREKLVDAKVKNPVLQLSDDLILFEYLKKECPKCLIYHRNSDQKTADELFAINNEELRVEAMRWLERTAEHCTVVIVLIATVAFAAAYTVPGGPNQQTGAPLLLGNPFFLVFTMTDVLSLAFALTAVVVFLSIFTSSFQLKQFRRSLPHKLLLGLTLLFLSVTMMMFSFAATIILTIHNKERWTRTAAYLAAFFPVAIFVLSYLPLYFQLADFFKYWVMKIGKSLPRFVRPPQTASLCSSFTSSDTPHEPNFV